MSKISVLLFLLIVTPMMYFFFKPKFYIKSYVVTNDNLSLVVCCKSRECGFINITSENIVYQYSLGLHGKKGVINLTQAILDYQNSKILFNTTEGKNIISIECTNDIYNVTLLFLNEKMKIRNSPDYKSKRDLFFGN